MRMHTRIEKLEATLRVDECLSDEEILTNYLKYMNALHDPRTRASAMRNPVELDLSHETLKKLRSILVNSSPDEITEAMLLQACKVG